MKFYNREKELELVKTLLRSEGTTFIVVKGLRRIGKTSLILESLKGKKFANIFVPKDKTTSLFLEELSHELEIPLFSRLIDLFRYIFEKYEIIFIDEFQNFYNMDKSAYSDIQKLFEELKRKKKRISILVTGSSYSLIGKIFSDYAKALYGRKDLEITLEELSIPTIRKMLSDLGIKDIEEQIKFWSVFGGIPKFYELVEKFPSKSFDKIMELFYSQIKSLVSEGNSILISEFGSSYKIYYSVMEAIAQGKTKLSEISTAFKDNPIVTNRYLDIMRREYNLIAKMTPITEDVRKSKQGIYIIKNNFLKFWFAFIKRYENYYEQNRSQELFDIFNREFSSFVGMAFEDFCLEAVKKINFKGTSFIKVGRQWGKILGAKKGRNAYEIDICALNDENKEILLGECKWKNDINPIKIMKELKEKSQYIRWACNERKEHYVVFAKSFKNKDIKKIKKELNLENVYLFDLKDIEKLF